MHHEHSSNPNAPVHRYTFGELTLSFKGLGVPILGDRAREQIQSMDYAQAKAANRAAWKAYEDCTRIMNRHANASISGNQSTYDHACQHWQVADQVKRMTWERMRHLQS